MSSFWSLDCEIIHDMQSRGSWRGKMGAGIGLFLGWENGIGVTGTGIWPLGMENEVLKNGNGIEIMAHNASWFPIFCTF